MIIMDENPADLNTSILYAHLFVNIKVLHQMLSIYCIFPFYYFFILSLYLSLTSLSHVSLTSPTHSFALSLPICPLGPFPIPYNVPFTLSCAVVLTLPCLFTASHVQCPASLSTTSFTTIEATQSSYFNLCLWSEMIRVKFFDLTTK